MADEKEVPASEDLQTALMAAFEASITGDLSKINSEPTRTILAEYMKGGKPVVADSEGFRVINVRPAKVPKV